MDVVALRAVWFSLHTLFGEVRELRVGLARLLVQSSASGLPPTFKTAWPKPDLRQYPLPHGGDQRFEIPEVVADDVFDPVQVHLRVAVDEEVAESGHVPELLGEAGVDPAVALQELEQLFVGGRLTETVVGPPGRRRSWWSPFQPPVAPEDREEVEVLVALRHLKANPARAVRLVDQHAVPQDPVHQVRWRAVECDQLHLQP